MTFFFFLQFVLHLFFAEIVAIYAFYFQNYKMNANKLHPNHKNTCYTHHIKITKFNIPCDIILKNLKLGYVYEYTFGHKFYTQFFRATKSVSNKANIVWGAFCIVRTISE